MKKLFSVLLVIALLATCAGALAVIPAGELTLMDLPIVPEGEEVVLTVAVDDLTVGDASYNDGHPAWDAIQRNLGITIKWEVFPGSQYDTNAQARLAAGANLPDIMRIPGTTTDAIRYAQQGIFIPLGDLIAEYAPDITQLFDENESIRKGNIAPDGEVYFLGNYLTSSPNGQSLIIRQDWLDTLSLEAPETMDEWYDTLCAFRDNAELLNGGTYDIVAFGGDTQDLKYFFSGFGLPTVQDGFDYWYDENGECYYFCMTDAYLEWLTFCNKLYTEGLLDPNYGSGVDQLNDMIKQNRVGTIVNHTGVAPERDAWLRNLGVADANHVWLLPPKDANGTQQWYSLNNCRNTERHGITYTSEIPEIAIKFLDYVYASVEGTRLTLCGVEDVNYTVNEDGTLTFMDFMMNDPTYDINQKLRTYGLFDYIDIQTQEFNDARITGKFKGFIDMIAANPEVCKTGIPVLIPVEDEQDTIQELWPDIKAYIDEMTIKFITGGESLDNFDAFRATLEGLGITDLAATYTGMYARYNEG